MTRKFIKCLPLAALLLAACGGGGNSGTSAPQAPAGDVTLSGRISFNRVPFKTNVGSGLDFARISAASARGVVVEAVDNASSAVLTSTTTDAGGNYSLTVPGNRTLFVRAKAQMTLSGSGASWNFRVLNNTNANSLYVLDGAAFNSGTTSVTRNLLADSGWNGSTYAAPRAAAPFAILDTVYQAKELLLTAQPNLQMPALDLYWSISNRPATPFCPSSGNIVSTGYQGATTDNCPVSSIAPAGIYIQGDFSGGAGDTDEFDQAVIAHEFGHYVESAIGRSDSVGGSHTANDRLDPRVAMSEGWGNAFSAMVLNDPIYRDSIGTTFDNNFDMESGPDINAGWFSETTVQQVLWDIFDSAADSGDGVALGFTPIYQTIVGPQRSTSALASLHSFVAGLKTIVPSAASAINALLVAAPRNITGTDEYATGETNNGGETNALPLYIPLALNQTPIRVCSTARFGSYNRLANRKFLRLDLSGATSVTITVVAAADPGQPSSVAAKDPDAVLWRQGARVWNGSSVTPTGTPTETSPALQLQGGTHILEVYDYLYADPINLTTSATPRCMTVAVTG